MTNEQRRQLTPTQKQRAIELHNSGVTWSIIASLNNISATTLRKQLKDYETTKETSDIHRTIGTG